MGGGRERTKRDEVKAAEDDQIKEQDRVIARELRRCAPASTWLHL